MFNQNFYDIYNEKNKNINLDNIKIDYENPINTLDEINKMFYDGIHDNKKEYVQELNLFIKEILKINEIKPNLRSISRCISLIRYYQIYHDGNHRTAYIFFKILMKKYFPKFDYKPSSDNDVFNSFFDIYYDENDVTYDDSIKNIEEHIKRD